MLSNTIKTEYRRWIDNVTDSNIHNELIHLDNQQIEDAFFKELSFGTGGLRGIMGAGTNRMNCYTVSRASQGVADYLNSKFQTPSVAVSYDSRINSRFFSEIVCSVLAANGIKVWIYEQLMPTPCLSYAVRSLGCSAGIMITASHNPAEYNGYKVYGCDGCQITDQAAKDIQNEINKLDYFKDVKTTGFEDALNNKTVEYIDDSVVASFFESVENQSVLYGDKQDKSVSIVYSPLNGTGLVPVTSILEKNGYNRVVLVEEQKDPDGRFPTCRCPNPEEIEALELGLEYCKTNNADLLVATDPDCDRCGIAVRSGSGYRLLSGNETGILLLDYICHQRSKHGMMPDNPVFIKTIVTTDLAEKIADYYGVKTVNVLTGFKYIGEYIGKLEDENREKDFIFGFEESYGYLTGTYVRDKDAVNAVFIICEMLSYYRFNKISIEERLEQLYQQFGYALNTLKTYKFEGITGMQKMTSIMNRFRTLDNIGVFNIKQNIDYFNDIIEGLPKSNVIKLFIENASIVIRPSGTEPKLKIYLSISASDEIQAQSIERQIDEALKAYLS